MSIFSKISAAIQEAWCSTTHAGGYVKRDAQGRINWQCARCGRWGDPVSIEDERDMVDYYIADYKKIKGLK
jgi:hypothetical protein